jgi:DNA polymerase-3 subunit gamma/tau
VGGVSYQVFARKYRPQTFDDVVSQEHITRTLKNAIAQNRLAHAYLFVGPRGTGKTSTARILAKALCCVNAPTTDPCGVCDACREIASGISLDVLEIDGASNNGVEQVRELRENVRYAPTRGAYKIYIIDEVHMLTAAAFNALLKTLEEPPEHVKFIFATTEPQKVLPTILSRCQRFDLRRIPTPLIDAHLQKIAGLEKIDLTAGAAEAIARGADGGLRDAESMLDQLVAFCGGKIALEDVLGIFGFTAPETVAKLAESLLRARTSETLGILDAQSEAGKDLLRLLAELIGHLRNLLVYQVNAAGVKEEAGENLLGLYENQSALISTDRLLELIDQFAAAESRMKWAPNKKLHFEIALIKAIQTLGQSTLTEVIDALTALREGSGGDILAAVPALKGGAIADRPAITTTAPPPATVAPAPAASSGSGMDWKSLKQAVAQPSKPVPKPAAVTPAPAPTPVLPPSPVPADIAPTEPAPPPASPAAREILTPPAQDPPPAPVDAAPLDGPRVWNDLIREIQSQRPLITAWVKMGRLLGVQGDVFRVGYPPDQKMVVESLGKSTNRKFLEGLLAKLAGRPVSLKLELTDEQPPPPSTPPPPAADPSSDGSPRPAAPAPAFSGAAAGAEPSLDPLEAFKNDPQIQKALQLFEGEIRSVNP